jgi:hypothetical protein
MTKKIGKPDQRANLPEQRDPDIPRQPVNAEQLYRGVCASILRDPVSSPADKMRAVEGLMRFKATVPTTAESLAREEIAALSDEELDEVLNYPPLHQRDRREVERELEQRTAKLEAEFNQRVEARVSELVDVEAVDARIERRAREIAEQGRPLIEVPVPRLEANSQPEPAPTVTRLPDWPPDRKPRR